jgi:DNA-binding NarL/FixJ family response regulator
VTETGAAQPPGGKRLRVLIADDDPLVRERVRDALQLAGLVVIAGAADGREAVELARHYRPDVVLMDVVMPVMDGIEATSRIMATVPETRIVMLTRSDDDELGLLGLKVGAVGFLSKRMAFEAIPRAVRGAAGGEAAISRRLSMLLVERLREPTDDRIGVRPVSSPLTPREWEVLDLLCAEQGTEQIADRLVVSVETVRSHIRNILRKLDVRSRAEAVARAAELRSPASPAR